MVKNMMKKITPLGALSITTAILCGIWAYVAGIAGLISWAGFAGCTTYFASGEHGIVGMRKTLFPNLLGVLLGMILINLSALFPMFGELGIWCGIITFVMCMSSNFKLFDFCPGIFMGCFTTFAANGQWKGLVLALVIGAFLGIACDYSGMWLYKAIRKE